MSGPRRLLLVGFMGSGKSSIGPLVAARLRFGFIDMDRLIEQRAGLSIAEIFRSRGEQAFRDQERLAAGEIAGLSRQVVAAGGGALTQGETRRLLRTDAFTLWLRCSLETVLARVAGDPTRPLAADRERIALLFAERNPNYALADAIIDADRLSFQQAADAVVAAWWEHRDSTGSSRR